MERSKYFIITLILVFFYEISAASYKSEIYQAYISNDMTAWKKTIDKMNLEKTKSNEFILELLNYQYGYIGWCLGNDKEEMGEIYLALAKKNVETLEQANYKLSEVNAYKSALYGYEIGLSVFKAPFIGPKSMACAEKAIKLDKSNPYGYIQIGNAEFYMPSAFGGSKKKALDYFKKAQKLMEADKENIKNDWNYLSLIAMIGVVYTKLEQYKNAKIIYENLLKFEPNFLWVKDELYPKLIQEHNIQG